MENHDFLTPKDIANRIRSRLLRKLRWYCQLCKKQCGSEHEFNLHCLRGVHQHQIFQLTSSSAKIVELFSEFFERVFLHQLRQNHRFSRVAATVVHDEIVVDWHHVDMKATKWLTLTDFVTYLGRTGKCMVQQTPQGWFLTCIDDATPNVEIVEEDGRRQDTPNVEIVEEDGRRQDGNT